MKKALIVAIVIGAIAIYLISGFYFLPSSSSGVKTYSNVTELYSLFSQYMSDTVVYHLQAVDCEPSEYYYNYSSVCFICNGCDACFGYAWVNKTEGERMNPKGTYYLTGNYSNEKLLDFRSAGFSKVLGCSHTGECSDGIAWEVEEDLLIFSFPEDINVTEKVRDTFQTLGMDCEFTPSVLNRTIFSCKALGGSIAGNEVML